MPPIAEAPSVHAHGRELALAGIATLLAALPLFFLPAPLSAAAAIAIGLAPIGIVITFRNPFLLCMIFIVFSFFRIHEAFPVLNPLKIPSLVAILTLTVLSWHVFMSRSIKPFWSRELTLFAVFFALTTVGIAFAVNRPTALAYWSATYVKIATMVLAIAWLVRDKHDFALAARALTIAGSAIAIVALQNKAAGIGLVEGTRVTIGRDLDSVLGDPNDLALVLLFPLAFAVSMLIMKTGVINRILGLATSGLVVAAIVATQSRGGLIGIMAVCGTIGLRLVKNKILFMGAGAAAAMVLFVAMGINDRASGGAHEEGIDESAMGRIYAWGAAWRMALARPLNGVGLNNFTDNYFFYSEHWDGMNHAVHSTWFNVLAETGFLGLGVFIAMIVICVLSSLRSLKALLAAGAPPIVCATAMAMVGGLAGFCAGGTFLTQGFTWPIYILLALTTATARYCEVMLPKQAGQPLPPLQTKPARAASAAVPAGPRRLQLSTNCGGAVG